MPEGAVADGLIVVDKPAGLTSHDVVARGRRLARTRRVGHAGTLDPMATGVLLLGVGRGTRLLTYLVGAEKDYDATIRLGIGTTTDDAEGEVTSAPGAADLDEAALSAAVAALTGDIRQVPSTVSAIKVDGKRAYARVRAGEDVALAARPVTVSRFDVVARRDGTADRVPVVDLDVRVTVSSGTYVRALARDLGAALGSAGHLTALRRTRVGPWGLDRARTLEQLESAYEIVPLAEAASTCFPVRRLDAEEARRLGHGQRLAAEGLGEGPVAGIGPDGRLVALLGESEGALRPLLVVAPA